MHLHRSAHNLRTLKVGAWHYLLNVLMGTAAVGIMGYSLYDGDRFYMVVGSLVLAFCILSSALFFLRRLSLRCPLCSVPLWSGQKCQKHRKVKPALGVSYRLGVASAVIFKGSYRCPYCGEPFSARKSRRG